jgi:NAD(P)-dependent dehydrogenase (short-subunit alcohol dehydrogenase family)
MTANKTLEGKIALVTGASRGIGRGIARALGEQGATVYITGRTVGPGELSLDTTARMIEELGGTAIPVQTDHTDDDQIAALFDRVKSDTDHLDLLVNNVFKIPTPPVWGGGFWEHPFEIWDDQVGTGARCHYVACWHAAELLFAGPTKVIVNISSPGGLGYHFSTTYGVGKTALDRMTADMAVELEPKGVASIALYPGSVATEFIVESNKERQRDMSVFQTPLFVGRSVAALTASGTALERSGQVLWVEDLAEEFDLVDENGSRPPGYSRRAELTGNA